jgi:transcriptional regulator with XRE-family HTH domain
MDQNQLAGRIRAFRKLKGYTQQEFSDKLGVSVAVLGAVERGTRVPDRKLLLLIAQTLDVDIEELTGQPEIE